MGFEDKDRETLVQVHTDIAWIKKEHGHRLDQLEAEDKLLHHRINKVQRVYVGASAAVGMIAGAIAVWFKSRGGN